SIVQVRCETGDFSAQEFETSAADFLDPPFPDDKGALPIVLAIEHHKDAAGVKPAKGLIGIRGAARQSHPQYVHWRTEIDDLQRSLLAHRRMPSVGSNNELGSNCHGALGSHCL